VSFVMVAGFPQEREFRNSQLHWSG